MADMLNSMSYGTFLLRSLYTFYFRQCFTAPFRFSSIFVILFYCQFNPLQPGVAFLYPPENIRKPKGFLMFSGGIEKQHRAVMG